jgi:hypothetical protein
VTRDTPASGGAVFTIDPHAIPAGTQLDIVFPYPLSGGTAKPAPAQAAPTLWPSPPADAGHQVAHPVAIRLIPATNPRCVVPSPVPSPS